jgi:hypothetical protein
VRSVGYTPPGWRAVTGGGAGVVKVGPPAAVGERELCDAVATAVTATEVREALDGIPPLACTNLAD